MQFLIILIFTILAFGICFAVLVFKGRRQGGTARLHSCGGHEEACQCRASHTPRCAEQAPFDLQATLEKARKID
jgi:hypothetical protein